MLISINPYICSLRTLCRALRHASRNIYGRTDRSIYEVGLFLDYYRVLLSVSYFILSTQLLCMNRLRSFFLPFSQLVCAIYYENCVSC